MGWKFMELFGRNSRIYIQWKLFEYILANMYNSISYNNN